LKEANRVRKLFSQRPELQATYEHKLLAGECHLQAVHLPRPEATTKTRRPRSAAQPNPATQFVRWLDQIRKFTLTWQGLTEPQQAEVLKRCREVASALPSDLRAALGEPATKGNR
jgi:hypothetical protein